MRLPLATMLLGVVAGCTCKQSVSAINPSITVAPVGLDFGKVKLLDHASRTVRLEAKTTTPVQVKALDLAPGSAPGGPEGFSLDGGVTQIDALGSATVEVTFSPTQALAYETVLTIASNDPDHPTVRVLVDGQGATPTIEVTPDCGVSRGCVGTVVVNPPSIDFGAQPLSSPLPVDPTKLPAVNVVNAGEVPLRVTRAEVQGADAAAFTFAGNATFPSGGVDLEASAGFNLAIRFQPTDVQQQSYRAQLVIECDDPVSPIIRVELQGTLLPDQPPVVCANLVRVVPTDDAPRDYSSGAEWSTLIPAPAGGYDFTLRRDVRPGDLVILSAISDSTDPTQCTSDPELGRAGLSFAWRLASAPPGAQNVGLSGAATPQAQLRPVVTGDYTVELRVADASHVIVVPLKLAVAIKQDLVAQLQWTGFSDVDLDLHLVRPSAAATADPFSGVFQFFETGAASRTSGDSNGYAVTTQRNLSSAGFDFDWGLPGTPDDPKLNVDDTGSGALVENVSLNSPENDAACATSTCAYKVLVHYFKDGRSHAAPPGCVVDGGAQCLDGQVCSCAPADRCVADSAPSGDAGTGAGKCYPAPQPVVRLFFHGSAAPATVIPLDTLTPPDDQALGAPCQMLYVADVNWPAKSALGSLPDGGTPPPTVTVKGADGTGRIAAPLVGRFGWRQAGGSLQCSPDEPRTVGGNTLQWYSRQP